MPDLIVENIEKQLGTAQVLCGVSFELHQGEVLALLAGTRPARHRTARASDPDARGIRQPEPQAP